MSAGKLVICHRAAPGGSQKATQSAWRTEVGPQTLALREDLGFVRYAQLHSAPQFHLWGRAFALTRRRPAAALIALTAPGKGYVPGARSTAALARAERWSVLDELWWPSLDEMLAAATSPRGLAALTRLRELWAPHAPVTAAVVCRERIIAAPREERPDTARIGFCIRPRPQDSPEEMQAYWGENHTELVRSLTEQLGFDQYDRTPAVLDDPRAGVVIDALGGVQDHPYVGIASLSFPTIKDLVLRFLRPTAQIANFKLMQDELAFIDPPGSPPLLGTRLSIY